ncbi:MAG TPA: TonB family protein [Chthoniobacterales bacterium]|nr:TonB family protein [Chthoniobacterales bacterium]
MIFLAVDLSWSQVTEVPSAKTTELPAVRPILVGHGPNALIDRIDGQGLIAKGQKNALIMFVCAVRKTGEVEWSELFGATPDSRPLQEELAKRLSPASEVRFIPAIYNHQPVDAIYYGTLTFAVLNGKPRLRIFSNQERAELEAEHDFIGPQPFFGPESKFNGFHYPDASTPVTVDGFVHLAVKVDINGSLEDARVVSEEPPLLGFANAALADFRGAKFIPAFRDGKPAACQVTLPVIYKARTF